MSSQIANNNNNTVPLVYIPRIGQYTQEQIIQHLIGSNIAVVSRVDFVELEPKDQDKPQVKTQDKDTKYYSAFLHVSIWINQSIERQILANNFRLYINDRQYWILLVGKPVQSVPETKLNIHQIACYTQELEKKNAELEEKNNALEKRMESFEECNVKRMEMMEDALSKQSNQIDLLIAALIRRDNEMPLQLRRNDSYSSYIVPSVSHGEMKMIIEHHLSANK
jgi:hypothetical protein